MSAHSYISGVLQDILDEGLQRGFYSGAAAGVATRERKELVFAGTHAFGDATPVGPASLFDLASVSKTVTASVLVRMSENEEIDLDAPVADVLPVGSGRGAGSITARMLLLHTSGLPAESLLWRDPTVAAEERLGRVLSTRLESEPGEVHRYSCLGYIAAGAVAAHLAGRPWPELVRSYVTEPLGLESMRYGPVPAGQALATEDQFWTARGVLRGEVHDELNWYLGGAVGNAGLFATAADTLDFAVAVVGKGLFGPDGRRMTTHDGLSSRQRGRYGQAMGARISDPDVMGDLPVIGHPGFTGTLWIGEPKTGTAAVLLTNRVHPRRDRANLDALRRRFSAAAFEVMVA